MCWALIVAAAGLVFALGILAATRFVRSLDTPARRRLAIIGLKEIPLGHPPAPWLSTALSELVKLNLAEMADLVGAYGSMA